MDYISTKEDSEKWGISGVISFSRVWAIRKDVAKPPDARLREQRKDKKNEL